jgi:apolipoprotein N-acyltransferase
VPALSATTTGPRWLLYGAAIVAGAAMLGLYARGGPAWILGFVMLVPWMLALDRVRSLRGALLAATLISIAFILAVFTWFGVALHAYTGIGALPATLVLCLLAPLLQPQVIAFAIARQLAGHRHGPWLRAIAGASAWVGVEWLWPKLLGDTLGHGLLPSTWLRQAADLGGAAGLSFALILVNESIAVALARRRDGWRALMAPLAVALAIPLSMSIYGALRLDALRITFDAPAPVMRIGLVQSGIVDYERLREEIGTYEVVRQVLDTHFALSRAAIEHHGADALLWSETVYPTTFGQPRSEDGSAFDREILDFVTAVDVPLLFGTYDLDDGGEYNAAALVEPQGGLLAMYRKTHPFPLTEHVPAWLDGPLLRRALPWAGSWSPGDGARVLPIRAKDGRELNVVPLICLDDVRPQLAIDGARLGAQAIVGLSNDSWFSNEPLGARLHLSVAAFRSIETRLPQVRVTNNGMSALIDPTGEILVATTMGDRAVLAGELPLRDPPPTLMIRWGDWIGGAGLGFLTLLALVEAVRRLRAPSSRAASVRLDAARDVDVDAIVLTPPWRVVVTMLNATAAIGLCWIAWRMLTIDGLQVNSMLPLKLFAWLVLVPCVGASAITWVCAVRARVLAGALVLQQRSRRIEIPIERIAALRAWRWPLPASGIDVVLASQRRVGVALPHADPAVLRDALLAAGAPPGADDGPATLVADYATTRAAARRNRLDHPLVKFALFPLLLALPAFRLHQNIAFGGSFGEWYTYGAMAWLTGLLIWWASWSLGMMLLAAALRVAKEAITVAAVALALPGRVSLRRALDRIVRVVFYLGVPAWLGIRLIAG